MWSLSHKGDFDLLTSQFNHIRSKHIFIKLRSGARIVFDQTLILLGTHFRIQSWGDPKRNYLQVEDNVNPMFRGYGCVGFFDYFGGQIRTDRNNLTIAQEANGGDHYGSDGALFVRYRNVSFKRIDGSNIDATTDPLSITGKNLDALRYGANFGGAPQTNALYLNGATYKNM